LKMDEKAFAVLLSKMDEKAFAVLLSKMDEDKKVKVYDVHVTLMIVASLFLVVGSQTASTFDPIAVGKRQLAMWTETSSVQDPSVEQDLARVLVSSTMRIQMVSLWAVMASVFGVLIELFLSLAEKNHYTGKTCKVISIAGKTFKAMSIAALLVNVAILIYLCFSLLTLGLNIATVTCVPLSNDQVFLSGPALLEAIDQLTAFVQNGSMLYLSDANSNNNDIASLWTFVLIAQTAVVGLPLLLASCMMMTGMMEKAVMESHVVQHEGDDAE